MKFPTFLLLGLALLSGCASAPPRAVITDRHGTQTEVYAVDTDPPGALDVLNGLARTKVRLNEISVLEISPVEVKTIEGDLYYLAEVWLTDGSKMEPALTAGGGRTEPYVNVNSKLTAKTSAGSFTISMKDVKQLRFVAEKK